MYGIFGFYVGIYHNVPEFGRSRQPLRVQLWLRAIVVIIARFHVAFVLKNLVRVAYPRSFGLALHDLIIQIIPLLCRQV